MKSQVEQIKAAKYAYIMPLSEPSNTSGTCRFAIYLQGETGEMDVLWPRDSDLYNEDGTVRKKRNLLHHQCYNANTQSKYPAFHFKLSGWGYSKALELKTMLRQHNSEIEVRTINGWAPSFSF